MTALLRYRLQTLYEVREHAKKNAFDAYIRAKHQTQIEEQTYLRMKNMLKDMIALRERKRFEYSNAVETGSQTVDKMNVAGMHLKSLKEKEEAYQLRIDKQKLVLDKAKSEEQLAQDFLVKTTQELKALEKHKEKWAKERQKDLDKREAETADDVAQTQFFETLRDKDQS